MLYAVIVFFLCVVPFIICPTFGDGLRIPKEIASIFGFLLIITVALRTGSFSPSRCIRLFYFLFWCFLFTAVNFLTISLHIDGGIIDVPALLFAWKELFYIALAIFAIHSISSSNNLSDDRVFKIGNLNLSINNLTNNQAVEGMSKAISKILLITCLYSLVQALGFDPIFRCQTQFGFVFGNNLEGPMSHRIVSTIGNPTIMASFIAIIIPFALYSRRYITFALAVIVLILSASSAGQLVSLTSCSIYLLLLNRKIILKRWKISILVLLSIFIAISLSIQQPVIQKKLATYFAPTGRIEVLKESWNMIKNKPLTGTGLGTFEYIIGKNSKVASNLKNEHWKEMHNEYGQVVFSVGLIGLSLLGFFVVGALKRFYKNMTKESILLFSSLVSVAIISMVLFPFRVAPTSFYIVIITGMFLRII